MLKALTIFCFLTQLEFGDFNLISRGTSIYSNAINISLPMSKIIRVCTYHILIDFEFNQNKHQYSKHTAKRYKRNSYIYITRTILKIAARS